MANTSNAPFMLSEGQVDGIRPLLSNVSWGGRNADIRLTISGIIHVINNCVDGKLRWRDAPKAYGPFPKLRRRFAKLRDGGNLVGILDALADEIRVTHRATREAARKVADMTGGKSSSSGRHFWLTIAQPSFVGPR